MDGASRRFHPCKDTMKKQYEFGVGVILGLVKASAMDVDVFLIFLGAFLRAFKPFRSLGDSLLFLVILRRADQYAGLLDGHARNFAHNLCVNREEAIQ